MPLAGSGVSPGHRSCAVDLGTGVCGEPRFVPCRPLTVSLDLAEVEGNGSCGGGASRSFRYISPDRLAGHDVHIYIGAVDAEREVTTRCAPVPVLLLSKAWLMCAGQAGICLMLERVRYVAGSYLV